MYLYGLKNQSVLYPADIGVRLSSQKFINQVKTLSQVTIILLCVLLVY